MIRTLAFSVLVASALMVAHCASGDDNGALFGNGGDDPLGGDGTCAANESTQTKFVNLAVPKGQPLDRTTGSPIPGADGGAPPPGWLFYQIDGTVCRDGSPNGIYARYAAGDKVLIYLEGGGACDSDHFCDHNPKNLNEVFPNGSEEQGQTIGGSLFTVAGVQAPPATGIFDNQNDENPFKEWSEIYVPYCTGDVHFGTKRDVPIPNKPAQQFVGHLNLKKFMSRVVPTFPDAKRVVLTGASAGGFGAGLNLGLVQDTFGDQVTVTALDDSGPPFSDQYLPACLQKKWRDLWGFDDALPSDCAECRGPEGGGITQIPVYWHHKYKDARVALISSVNDEVIRLFFSQGVNDCASDDPNVLVIGGLLGGANSTAVYSGADYEKGLYDLRSRYLCTGVVATYFLSGSNHQHIFRSEFYQPLAGKVTPAAWVTDWLNGTMTQVGP